jgi:protein O-mannosyl-transferase
MKLSRTPLGALALAFAVLAVYGMSIGYEFVYDDHVQIERNPWLRDPRGFQLFLTRPFWGFYPDRGAAPSNYYRPVFGIFYSLVARGFGLQPAAYHVASVALYLAVTLLVALGARRLLAGRRGADAAALAAGLVFAVHPAHAEAVAWIGDQADLLTALFVLAALFLYLRRKDRGEQAGWAGPLCYLLACLAKERWSWCSAPWRWPSGGGRDRSPRPCGTARRVSRPTPAWSPSISPCGSTRWGAFRREATG